MNARQVRAFGLEQLFSTIWILNTYVFFAWYIVMDSDFLRLIKSLCLVCTKQSHKLAVAYLQRPEFQQNDFHLVVTAKYICECCFSFNIFILPRHRQNSCFYLPYHIQILRRIKTRTTRTPAFWGYPPPPQWLPTLLSHVGSPKSKQGLLTLKI